MRHPLHSICPYFAMFPEDFVAEQLLAHSRPGDTVLDPFCGRGTTIFESLLSNRRAIGSDINPVAACVAGAKAHAPALNEVLDRVDTLEAEYRSWALAFERPSEFFVYCYHPATYGEIAFLRGKLNWQDDPSDRFVAALMLGALHGESHRSGMYLSNRMPRTISTKPGYSVRWWRERGYEPPERRTFDVLRRAAGFRLSRSPPALRGDVALTDSRNCADAFHEHEGSVALVVTSPPYIDTTDYAEDQWLRLWFLGGEDRPRLKLHRDDRHTRSDAYWRFLKEVWEGCANLLRDEAIIVVRIGGTKLSKEELRQGLWDSLTAGLSDRRVMPTSHGTSSAIAKRQTNSFRPGTSSTRMEHDFTFVID